MFINSYKDFLLILRDAGDAIISNVLAKAEPIPLVRNVELHSPDAKHTVVLRSIDAATSQAWFNVINAAVGDLVGKAISEVKEQLGKTGISGSQEIRHLGWLAEKGTCTGQVHFVCFDGDCIGLLDISSLDETPLSVLTPFSAGHHHHLQ